jgi:hypothetical protein
MKTKNVLMSDLLLKIQELIKVSAENYDEFLGVKGGNWNEKFENKMKRQETLMDELKEMAKARNTLLGRTLQFPMADSYALYLIIRVNKTSAVVLWLDYCDAWQDDRLGKGGSLPLTYVQQRVKSRDALDELFSKKKLANV